METTMNLTRTILALFVAVLALPMAVVGQAAEASANATSNDEVIDDIVVVGQKSLNDLRRDVFKAEEDFYSVFNNYNDEKDYDVRCFYENATGTRIKNHVCRARFVTKSFEKHARRNRGNMASMANQNSDPAFAEKTARYQENLETLIAANPELHASLVEYNTQRAQFMAKRHENDSN